MATTVFFASIFTCTTGVLAIKAQQFHRLRLFPPLAAGAFYTFRCSNSLSTNTRYNGLYAIAVFLYFSHICSALYIVQHQLLTDTWKEAWFMQFNYRWIGTNRSVSRNLPTTKSCSRGRFLRFRLLSIFTIYTIMCLYYDILALPEYIQIQPLDFSPSKRNLLRRLFSYSDPITYHELLVRLWFLFEFITIDYLTLTAFHDLFAFISVSIGLDDPEDWPPLYGNVVEAYTLRNYWAKFWHLLIDRMGNTYASWLSENVFCLQKRTNASRYLNNFLVFLFSGLMHACIQLTVYERPPGLLETTAWYCSQPLLFLVEERVMEALRKRNTGNQTSIVPRLLGYMWVFGFLFWSLPKFDYAAMYRAEAIDTLATDGAQVN